MNRNQRAREIALQAELCGIGWHAAAVRYGFNYFSAWVPVTRLSLILDIFPQIAP